ncbi:MAG: hypothetical protein Q7S84_04215 [bacterium]|nr:hypothetical protein [bacterium]
MVIWNIFPLVECFGSDPNPFLIAPAGFAPPGPYGLIPATVRYLMSVPLHPGSFILGWYDSPPQGICIAGVPPFGFPFFAMPVLTIGSSL